MTVTLDLPPRLIDKAQSDADAQKRPLADVLREAIADRYDVDSMDAPGRIPAADIDALRESLAQADRGELVDGPLVMRGVFARALGKQAA